MHQRSEFFFIVFGGLTILVSTLLLVLVDYCRYDGTICGYHLVFFLRRSHTECYIEC